MISERARAILDNHRSGPVAEIAALLSTGTETDRLQLCIEVITAAEQSHLTTQRWFAAARRVLSKGTSFIAVLHSGIPFMNASTAKDWLEFGLHAGARRTIRLIERVRPDYPTQASWLDYWLPFLARTTLDQQLIHEHLRRQRTP